MAKRNRGERKPCAYCDSAEGREGEHVFPRSWYPDTTPPTVQRLTVPACRDCNERWEQVERKLADEILLVVSPNRPEIAGVQERLTRAWKATAEQKPDERRHRIGRASKVLKTMLWAPPVPGRALATLRTAGGLLVRASPARRIENHLLRDIAEKFIKGLHYDETGGEVLRALKVDAAFIASDERLALLGKDIADALRIVLEQNPIHDLGPGFWYRRHREGARSVWAFRIWGQVNVVALANTGEDVPEPVSD